MYKDKVITEAQDEVKIQELMWKKNRLDTLKIDCLRSVGEWEIRLTGLN